eukprot:TRINITY_DN4781_c0_g1_i3.p1 TRINITY_DN4781_c0_g1~~TRINITY_DN4781_c0_g1_i3.p1  ORF type:complete len:510 (-),score=163.34 TRINITY_DN4781_c0_g1_i3:24-1553(-)
MNAAHNSSPQPFYCLYRIDSELKSLVTRDYNYIREGSPSEKKRVRAASILNELEKSSESVTSITKEWSNLDSNVAEGLQRYVVHKVQSNSYSLNVFPTQKEAETNPEGFNSQIGILPMKLDQNDPGRLNPLCYSCLLTLDNFGKAEVISPKTKSNNYILCLLYSTDDDEGFALFRPDLDMFCTRFGNMMAEAKLEFKSLEPCKEYLASWATYSIEYISRCVSLLSEKNRLAAFIYNAFSNRPFNVYRIVDKEGLKKRTSQRAKLEFKSLEPCKEYLASWATYSIEYISRCVSLLSEKNRLAAFIYNAFSNRPFNVYRIVDKEGLKKRTSQSSFAEDISRFIRVNDLSSITSASKSPLNPNVTSITELKEGEDIPNDETFSISMDSALYSININQTVTNEFCLNCADKMKQVAQARDIMALRRLVELNKFKVVEDFSITRRMVESSRFHNYPMYKAYRSLLTNNNFEVILSLIESSTLKENVEVIITIRNAIEEWKEKNQKRVTDTEKSG